MDIFHFFIMIFASIVPVFKDQTTLALVPHWCALVAVRCLDVSIHIHSIILLLLSKLMSMIIITLHFYISKWMHEYIIHPSSQLDKLPVLISMLKTCEKGWKWYIMYETITIYNWSRYRHSYCNFCLLLKMALASTTCK